MATLTYNFTEQSKKTADDEVNFYFALQDAVNYFKNNGLVPYSAITSAYVNMYGDVDTASNRANMLVKVSNSSGSYSQLGSYSVGGKNGQTWTGDIQVTWFNDYSGKASAGSLSNSVGGSNAKILCSLALTVLLKFTWKAGGRVTINYNTPTAYIKVVNGTSNKSSAGYGSTFTLTPTVPSGYKFSHWECSNETELTDYSPTITVNNSLITAYSTNLTYTAVLIKEPPKFTSAEMIYNGKQISEENKIIAGQSFVISATIT